MVDGDGVGQDVISQTRIICVSVNCHKGLGVRVFYIYIYMYISQVSFLDVYHVCA